MEGQTHLAGALGIRQGPGHLGIIGGLGGPLSPEEDTQPGDIGHGERAHANLLQLLDVFPTNLDDIDAPRPQHGHARGGFGHLEED